MIEQLSNTVREMAQECAALRVESFRVRECVEGILRQVSVLRREGIEDLAALQLWCDAVILNTETEYGILLDGAE